MNPRPSLLEHVDAHVCGWCSEPLADPRARYCCKRCRQTAWRALVDATDLHAEPLEPPTLLRGAWLLEVEHPQREALFEVEGFRCVALGGYELDGVRYLVASGYPDGLVVALWRPQWRGGAIEAGVDHSASPLIDASLGGAYSAIGAAAARLAVVLGLLLDAEGAPIERRDATPAPKRHQGPARAAAAHAWSVTRLRLTGGAETPAARAQGEATGESRAAPEGRVLAATEVRGHLKRQPHGPGGTLRRWIYVGEHSARRWVAPASKRILH